jgi:hypothetical protein
VSTHELRILLDQVADTREVVLRRPRTCAAYDAWNDAREETRVAYRRWTAAPTATTYAAYRAAQDREDAAQDMLAQTRRGAAVS